MKQKYKGALYFEVVCRLKIINTYHLQVNAISGKRTYNVLCPQEFSLSAFFKNSSFIWVPSNMSVFSFGQLLNRLGNDFPWMLRHFASVKDSIKGQFSATMWILSSVTQSHCVQSKKRSWCFLLNMLLNSRGLIQQ